METSRLKRIPLFSDSSDDELKQVDGIGEKRFAALEDSVGP